MKKNKILKRLFLILGIGFLISSCESESLSLGEMLEISDIDFEIIQDFEVDPGGNTVILTNKTPKTIITWDYGTGRSNKAIETVKFPFKGDYTINISALTAGGIVQLDPVIITVTEDNLNYVNDPLWTNLSGGVGESKTWVLDLNAEGVSKYFGSPVYFWGSGDSWDSYSLLESGMSRDDVNIQLGLNSDTGWNWDLDWAGNKWLMDAEDFGTMTFSLDGGPFVTTNNLSTGTNETGSYFLDKDAHTLSFTDATMLHNKGHHDCVADWASAIIFSLTEDTMQLGVFRNEDCESRVLLVYNFITKEYSDNWVAEEEVVVIDEGFEPTFASGELLEILTGGVAAGRYWKLDGGGNPIDWLASGIGWTSSSSDSYDWGWNDDWTTIASNSWIRFDQYGGAQNYYKDENGVESMGTFTIDESTNEITLSDNGTLIGNEGHWMTPASSTFTVVKSVPNDFGNFGLWFGTSYDADKDEWFVFHYVINNNVTGGGGSGTGGAVGTEIEFDNSKLVFGDIEENGNLRLELYNEYGSTNGNSPIDTSLFIFSDKIEVTFTLSGITLNAGAVGSYDTSMYYADTDWTPSGNGDIINVTGNGTYTVTYAPGVDVDGALVFVVDMVGIASDITDISAVTVTIDSVVIY